MPKPKVDEITLTQLELIERIAALVPPSRTQLHRYFGVLLPNSPHKAAAILAGSTFAALRHDRQQLFSDNTMSDDTQDTPLLQEARLWQDEHWTAQVIKNEDDDGWAVAMFKAGASEPALVGPWTMGRDKKNPKPLDGTAFITLVKTASEFVRRSEQQLHAQLNQSVIVNGPGNRITVLLRIAPDEDNPYALLSAQDEGGDALTEVKVDASFKLNRQTAQAWVDADFAKPGSGRR